MCSSLADKEMRIDLSSLIQDIAPERFVLTLISKSFRISCFATSIVGRVVHEDFSLAIKMQ